MDYLTQEAVRPGSEARPETLPGGVTATHTATRRRLGPLLRGLLAPLARASARRLSARVWRRDPVGKAGLQAGCEAVRVVLGALLPELEKTFLAVGEKMEAMDGCSRRLLGSCERLDRLAGSDQGSASLVKDSLEALREPLAYIDFCMTEHERLLALVERCEKKTESMLGLRGSMHDVIAPLTFMAVLFKIESAYLPDEMRETFSTVTAEVDRLHRLVDETFAKNAEQLEAAYQTLAGVRRQLESEFRRQAKQVAEKRERIERAVRTLDAQVSRSAERDNQVRRHGQELANQVSKVVVGIQFQDIVKQKCDHVLEALAGSQPDTARARLELRQLRSVEQDLQAGCGDIRQGFSNITASAGTLHQSSLSEDSFASMTAAVDGMVQSLLDALREVHDIIGMVTRLTEQGHAAVLPANGIASNLTEAIGELSINMRLIALNAQIRSVQGGQGTGLETLAARTAEISDDINTISAKVSQELGELHVAIEEMLSTFGQFLDRGREQNAHLGEARTSLETRLHGLRDETLSAVQEIGSEVDELRRTVADADRLLDGFPGLCSGVREAADRLDRSLPELVGEEFDAASLQGLEKRYTMASERKVHAEVLTAAGNGLPAQPPSEAAKTPTDNGGGVELF